MKKNLVDRFKTWSKKFMPRGLSLVFGLSLKWFRWIAIFIVNIQTGPSKYLIMVILTHATNLCWTWPIQMWWLTWKMSWIRFWQIMLSITLNGIITVTWPTSEMEQITLKVRCRVINTCWDYMTWWNSLQVSMRIFSLNHVQVEEVETTSVWCVTSHKFGRVIIRMLLHVYQFNMVQAIFIQLFLWELMCQLSLIIKWDA